MTYYYYLETCFYYYYLNYYPMSDHYCLKARQHVYIHMVPGKPIDFRSTGQQGPKYNRFIPTIILKGELAAP